MIEFRHRAAAAVLASSVALSCAACGTDGQRALQRCYRVAGSNEVCVEAISHRRSLGDIARKSPGITGRIYGKEGGEIVELTATIGGPDAPPEWHEQHGNPGEYLAGVKFEPIIALLAADPLPKSLQRHKDFLLAMLRDLAARRDELLAKPDTAEPLLRTATNKTDSTGANLAAAAVREQWAAETERWDARRPGSQHAAPRTPEAEGEQGVEVEQDVVDAWRKLDMTPADEEAYADGDGAASGKRYFGSFADTANRGTRPKYGREGEIYREKLEVFAEPFLWGIHSGTRTTVYRLEHGRWQEYRKRDSCNHGGCPGDKGMKLRFVCEPDVSTHGWYGLDGECANRWGPAAKDHYCNDDTALQINNAFGRWSGSHCERKHRKHAPKCEPQW